MLHCSNLVRPLWGRQAPTCIAGLLPAHVPIVADKRSTAQSVERRS